MKSQRRQPAFEGSALGSKTPERKVQATVAPRGRPGARRKTPEGEFQPEGRSSKRDGANHFAIVGVGASAGGLEAFTDLLTHLPPDTGLGFVLVQHLDPQHESALPQLLARVTSMPVREVTNNLRVEPNHVYAIPPNTSLGIAKGILKLHPRQQNRTPARSIDAFFESLAQDQRERAIGVVLSGTASDGTVGLEAIKAEGGITFAQDDSARYDSMPRSAVAAGCVDFVLKPEDIAKELARIAKHPYVAGQPHEPSSAEDARASATAHADDPTALPSGGHGTPPTGAQAALSQVAAAHPRAGEDGYKKVILLLRNHSGVDFSLYKSTTIQRRINRRVVLNKLSAVADYANYLRGNAKELDAVYSDVLISVTSFFRNPEAFDILKRKVFPRLLQQRGNEPVRVWILGCSTGQEAYSIAMAFAEAADNAPRARKLQVFATDLNDALLDKARHALYAKSLAQDVSPERLRRFFVEEEGGYRVAKPLREMVVFARQNLISDPPFSRIDLISCRNLLIYLEPGLQQKAIPTFHYALNPQGFLFLGASESIGRFTDLFEPADRKHKIFTRKAAPTQPLPLPVRRDRSARPPTGRRPPLPLGKGRPEPPDASRGELNAQREADRISVNQFAPPGVLVNADLQILQFRGPTGPYLQPPAAGKATFDILKMAREGLMVPLRAAINKALKENRTVRRENVRVQQNGNTRTVHLQVIPLRNLRERSFLILFEDAERVQPTFSSAPPPAQPPVRASTKETAHRVNALETELSETRDYLQSIEEQHEAANEELQASNEEVQSANEELQSINEELETSKEELESANEELTTVNEEMANRNAELNRLNADLTNLQTSTKLPIVLLGRDLAIRRFSALAERIFNLVATDIGRPLNAVRHHLLVAEAGHAGPSAPGPDIPFPLEQVIRQVIDTVQEQEHEARDKDGRWYSLRARPYITVDNKVDGAVLLLIDITELKRVEHEVKLARDYAEAIIRTARDPLIILHADLKVERANDAFYKTFKVTPQETENILIYQLGGGQWNIPKLRELLEGIIPRNSFFNDFEVTHDFEHIGRRTMLLDARQLASPAGQPEKILLGIEDISEKIHLDEEVRRSGDRFRSLVLATTQVVWTTNAEGLVEQDSPAWRAFTGQTLDQWRGWGWLDAIHPDDRERARTTWLGSVANKRIYETEYRVRAVDGTYRWTSVRAVPVLNADGGIREWIGANTDITERKRWEEVLRESEERYRTLFDLGPVAVYSIDTAGVIRDFNRRAVELCGRQPVLGDTDERFCGSFKMFRPDGSFMAHEHCPMAEVVSGKLAAAHDAEVIIERPDGSRVAVVVNIRPLKNARGETTGAINCFYDITERKRAEQALKASKDQLAAEVAGLQRLQETSTLLIQGGDTDTLYRQILDAAIALMGSDMGSMQRFYLDRGELRLLAWEGFDPESAAFWEWVRPASASTCGVALRTEQRVIVPDIEACDFLAGTEDLLAYRKSGIRAVQSTPLLSRRGKVVGMISTHWRQAHQPSEREIRLLDVLARQAADLIERSQTEQARAKLASIVQSSDDAIISKDLNGIITSWNKGAERLFGHTAAEAIGQPITILMPPDRVDEEPGILERIHRGESVEHHETVCQCKNGLRLDVSLTVSPIKNDQGRVIGASKIVRDITERKRTEESLRQAQVQLADRAGQLEQAVKERTAELTATNKQLEAFIYSVAHDLRAPLRAMQGFSSMLVKEAGTALSETGQDYAQRISRSAQFMDAMLIDMLAFSRISQQRLQLVPVSLETVITSILSRLDQDLQEKHARVEASGPWPAVLAHQPVLEQILFNLAGNALKFVSPPTPPIVRLRAEEAPDSVRVWVEDNGIGIDPAHQAQIFRLFNRLHGEKYPGTGIGLAIVQKGLERMGGSVGVESTPGQGSRFWITLQKAPNL